MENLKLKPDVSDYNCLEESEFPTKGISVTTLSMSLSSKKKFMEPYAGDSARDNEKVCRLWPSSVTVLHR